MTSIECSGPPAKRAKMVVFEPIRVAPVYTAKAISLNVLPAQHAKLCERFKTKLKQIASLEKRIDELENRHSSDDELICIINRQWNQLDETMIELMNRFLDESSINETVANNRSETNWLTVLSQLNNDEISQRLESRINFSKEALTNLLKAMNTYSQKRDRILAALESTSKTQNNNSPNGEDSRDAMEVTRESSDAKEFDIDSALRQELLDMAAENKRLEAMLVKLQKEKNSLSTKNASHNDDIECMEGKVENALNQLEDLRFELEKSLEREEKLEYQIIELKKNEQNVPQAAEPTQQKDVKPVVIKTEQQDDKADISQQQLEDLQHDLELQTEISEKRLAEIQTLGTQNQELQTKVLSLENEIKFLPTNVISNSPDYICLRLKYTHLVEESKRLESGNQELRSYIFDLRQAYEDSLKQVKNEFQTATSRIQDNCTQLSNEVLTVKKECANMELEFKQKYEADCIEAQSYKEAKQLITATRAEVQRRSEEGERMKKHIASLKAELKKAKDDLEEARKSSENNAENPGPVPPPPLLNKNLKLDARVDKPPSVDKLKRQVQGLTEQNEKLKRELNAANQAVEGLMCEMDNTAKAIDDFMTQIANLNDKIAEQNSSHIRQVKEGLQSEATLRVMKQNIEALEEKLKYMDNECQATKVECTTWEAKAEMSKSINSQLEATLRKTNNALDSFRRNAMNVSTDLHELKIRHEKQTAEVQDLRQQMKERVMNGENSRSKIARLREERTQLRKKLTRAKQASEYDNVDELLQHENQTLRESLACPSCKTNDKNTVLTKCFHVFCMDCIKRRYDARSRKCPKCNAGFGVNDFHRLYFE